MSADPVPIERRGVGQFRRRRRLLLVDDDAWCRGLADGVLRSRGYHVFCTGDARTAVSIAREMLPDLVLADVGLSLVEAVPFQQRRRADTAAVVPPPRPATGYAVLRPLGAEAGLASSPVILAGDASELGGPEALRFDVPEHVPKPFTAQVLLDKVARCLPERLERRGRDVVAPARTADSRERGASGVAKAVMEGAIDFIGVAALLEVFHSNQLTGTCRLQSVDDVSGEIGFEDGEIVNATTSKGEQGEEAVFRIVSWSRGRFSFGLTRPVRGMGLSGRFERLLLEAVRRLDEELHSAAEGAQGGRFPKDATAARRRQR